VVAKLVSGEDASRPHLDDFCCLYALATMHGRPRMGARIGGALTCPCSTDGAISGGPPTLASCSALLLKPLLLPLRGGKACVSQRDCKHTLPTPGPILHTLGLSPIDED
jgi:hypothetical protein